MTDDTGSDPAPEPRDGGESDAGERISDRLAHQWAVIRAGRRSDPRPVAAGSSNFAPAHVPYGLDLAAAWSWRFLVIVAAAGVLAYALGFLAVLTVPVAIALLIAALVAPVVALLARIGLPRGLAAGLVVIALIVLIASLLTFAGQQVANGANDLADSVARGLGEVKHWLRTGPLHASDSQINDYIDSVQKQLADRAKEGSVLAQVTHVGAAVGHIVAGLFIVLFSTYFFLADGERIWSWIVRIAPRAARGQVDSSGRVAWVSLTQFVRATVIVALTDAIGVMIGASILRVPFVAAIGVLVFLGAFVPIIGATFAGSIAVLVALVDRGPITALLMLLVVVIVQQVESHVLQPFLMGRFVSVHPLGVIFAIAAGVLVAGVVGALVAVPLAAALNAVVQHLASHTRPGDDPEHELEEDYAEMRQSVPSDLADRPEDDEDTGKETP